MIIYRCDKCGQEKTVTKGIVGNEFGHGFETLVSSLRVNGVTDVCSKCFKEIQDVHWEQKKASTRSINEKVKDFIKSI